MRRIKDYCFLRNDNDEISLLVDTLLPEQVERLEIESKSSVIRLFTNNQVSVSIQLSQQHLITMKELKSIDLSKVRDQDSGQVFEKAPDDELSI
ncbi:hypothetical protein CMV05_22245 (plasmid) [Vibrio anguillarum]|nr:hypothetical protein CMV05_22245 [Vibrio anguillarum]